MDTDPAEQAERGLRRYIHAIARALNVETTATLSEWSPPASGYIALAERLPTFPSRDVALVWDEVHGWAATVETYTGAEFVVLGYLLGDVLPAPQTVVSFARGMLTDHQPLHPDTPPTHSTTDLPARLAAYA